MGSAAHVGQGGSVEGQTRALTSPVPPAALSCGQGRGFAVAADLVYAGKNTPVNRTGSSPALHGGYALVR